MIFEATGYFPNAWNQGILQDSFVRNRIWKNGLMTKIKLCDVSAAIEEDEIFYPSYLAKIALSS